MYKVGDKLKRNWSLDAYKITSIDAVNDTATLVDDYGMICNFSRLYMENNLTKIDSDADSSGLYGVDDSDLKWNAWGTPYIQSGLDPFAKKLECQCGALKTYGESCNPEFHQSYCEMSKK